MHVCVEYAPARGFSPSQLSIPERRSVLCGVPRAYWHAHACPSLCSASGAALWFDEEEGDKEDDGLRPHMKSQHPLRTRASGASRHQFPRSSTETTDRSRAHQGRSSARGAPGVRDGAPVELHCWGQPQGRPPRAPPSPGAAATGRGPHWRQRQGQGLRLAPQARPSARPDPAPGASPLGHPSPAQGGCTAAGGFPLGPVLPPGALGPGFPPWVLLPVLGTLGPG